MAKILYIDFETYYEKGTYSLSKMTTEEYVRDPRFEVIGVSVAVDDGEPQWFSGDFNAVYLWLQQFPWAECAMVAHNAMFDAAIMAWRFGIRPKLLLCTQNIARALDGLATSTSLKNLLVYYGCTTVKGTEVDRASGLRRVDFTPEHLAEYARYCCDDVRGMREILLKNVNRLPKHMLRLQDWTLRAFTEPKLRLNTAKLKRELDDYRVRARVLLASAGALGPEQLRSDDNMAMLLQNVGVIPPTKLSPKQKNPDGSPKEVYAFAKSDLAFSDLLEHEDERVVALVEARLGLKTSMVESRLQRFIGISERGALPVPLLFAGAMATKRWSGTDKINLQNLPRNPKGGVSPLRDAIEAPPGFRICTADLSQIELRTNAWQSGETSILAALAGGGDVYSDMATDAFGFRVNKKDHPNERFVGKTAELGCGYQCGEERFHKMLLVDSRKYNITLPDSSFEFASGVVKTYRQKRKQIVNFWYAADRAIEVIAAGGTTQLGPYRIDGGKVHLPDGTYLYYPNLRREPGGIKGTQWVYDRMRYRAKVPTTLYGGKLVENITQATAAKFMSDALLRLLDIKLQDGSPAFHVVGTVHDELILLFPEWLDESWVRSAVTWAMTLQPSWAPDIPLECEVGIGLTYAEAK